MEINKKEDKGEDDSEWGLVGKILGSMLLSQAYTYVCVCMLLVQPPRFLCESFLCPHNSVTFLRLGS